MNKPLLVSSIALVAVMVGISIVAPAFATHTEDHRRNMYWIQGYCSTDDLCPVLVDLDRDGVCNLSYDVVREMPREFAQTLPVYDDNCIFVF